MPVTEELLQGGRYQLLGTLGEGSQGTTFDAIDKREGRPVAIKRFSIKGAASWKDVELAEREAAVLASLSHPSLPAHVDHFEEGGALYLVMEKIEGQSLAALTRAGGTLSQSDVIRFLRDAAGVLGYLHGRSPPVIHRDINPKNVIRRPDGAFVLVDFGAVRDRLRPEGGSTVVGTFGYMAPEQFQGRAVPGSDVYAVGATALRLLTGVEPEKLPHKGLALDVPAALGPGFDLALRGAIERMVEPNPDRRASNLSPLVDRLERGQERARKAARPEAQRSRGRETAREREVRREWNDAGNPSDWRKYAGDPSDWRTYAGEWADWSESRHWSRRQKRDWRRARRSRRRGRPLFGPPLWAAVVALNVAIMVVGLGLGIFVPLVLTLLSIFLGAPLRNAARTTRAAAEDARASLRRAEQFLLHGPTPVPPSPSVRVEEPEPPQPEPVPRARVRVTGEDDVVDTTGEEVKPGRQHQ